MTSLKFEKKITGDNAQGSCGLLRISDEVIPTTSKKKDCREIIIENKTDKMFYKFGNNGYNCTLARQEYIISQNLLQQCNHLPNFMRPVVYIKNHFVRNDKCPDPFSILKMEDKNKISCADVGVFEYIPNAIPFWNLLKKPETPSYVINSIVLQVCLAIICAQQNSEFTHNDLHANNILLIRTKRVKLLYRVLIENEEKKFVVDNYGYIPIIIDYGFSYSKECENMSLECIDSDNYGLITYCFDKISDFIRFFVVLHSSNYNKELKDKINFMFNKLPISFKSSWEKIQEKESSYDIEKVFYSVYKETFSAKVKNLEFQILKLMMRNIILPITYNKYYEKFSLDHELRIFFNEWVHIEKWFKYDYEKIYIFRELSDNIRKICNFRQNITKEDISTLSFKFRESIKYISTKEIPMKINWYELISSINNSVGVMQNMLYTNINNLQKKREEVLYKNLVSGEHMFQQILKYIYKDGVTLKSGDTILLIDNIEKSNSLVQVETSGVFTSEDIFEIFSDESY